MAIAYRGIATVEHLLNPKQELLTGGEAIVQAKTSTIDVAAVDALELIEKADIDLGFSPPVNGRKETIVHLPWKQTYSPWLNSDNCR